MVIKTVSIPDSQFVEANRLGVGISKATQLGLMIILKHGGLDKFEETIKNAEKFRSDNSDLLDINLELKKKITELKDEIDYLRKEYVKDDKNTGD